MITSLTIFNNESYVPERWHTSLIMIAAMVVPFVCNIWFRKVLDVLEMCGSILHIVMFFVFIAVFISFGPRNDSDFVFKTLIYDQSGWSNKGVCWGLGLLSTTFPVVGFDSVLHMCTSRLVPLKSFVRQTNMMKVTRLNRSAPACPSVSSSLVL